LTGFFKRGFSVEKRPSTFELWRVLVDGQERSFTGQKPRLRRASPLKPLFIFYRIFPKKSRNKDQASHKRYAVTGRR